LRRYPVTSRRSLEGDVSKWVSVIEIELGPAIVGGSAERRRSSTRCRMIEDVSRIHANGAFEIFADFESLGQSHVRAPNSRAFDRVQPDIATRTGLWVLQDDISRGFQSHGLQSAGRLQAGINR